ncbi:hypothetical protein CDD83_1452 [Cordyceps sp. RAO-2017]|nr:hypothetical protein CDD83_1452 [Cordyceps sp. RAO-2017]
MQTSPPVSCACERSPQGRESGVESVESASPPSASDASSVATFRVAPMPDVATRTKFSTRFVSSEEAADGVGESWILVQPCAVSGSRPSDSLFASSEWLAPQVQVLVPRAGWPRADHPSSSPSSPPLVKACSALAEVRLRDGGTEAFATWARAFGRRVAVVEALDSDTDLPQ